MKVEFRHAMQLAKSNPGSVLTRNDDGSFVVRNPDGSLVSDGNHDGHSNVSANAIRLLEEEILALRSKLHQQELVNSSLRKELDSTKSQLKKLAKIHDMIGKEELERIEKQELEIRRNERHTIQCSCRGEVENCHFCYGRGTYVTDGFGNRVGR